MPKYIVKTILIFVIGFVITLCLRLGYGYLKYPEGVEHSRSNVMGMFNLHSGAGQQRQSAYSFGANIKNYATKRKVAVGQPTKIDQKYEKVANVGLTTRQFEKDEKNIRDLIKNKAALIQFEQRYGLKGRRNLRLAVGVNPEHFDDFVNKVQKFGKLVNLTINKSDKTNEYRFLKAERTSLEKTREALIALKQREGKIQAMIELEQQILKLEQKLQSMGVQLGDFDTENEFVTVKLSLQEKGANVINIPLADRLLVAFTWTVKYYTLLWVGLFFALLTTLIGSILVKWFARLATSFEAK